ncbi:GYF domain-containing protein [Bdellovibrionota bacterium FG-2]
MENSEKPQWYIAQGERWIGPLRMNEVVEKIESNEITLAHYIWKQGQSQWKRICDLPLFKAAMPEEPTKEVQVEIKKASRPEVRKAPPRAPTPPRPPQAEESVESDEEAAIWFLFYNDSQFGPFSQAEVQRLLSIKKIHPRVHVWRDGLSEWNRLEDVQEFKTKSVAPPPFAPALAPAFPKINSKLNSKMKMAIVQPAEKVAAKPADRRLAPRRPLLARVLMTNGEMLAPGICRDVSVGGMQVLSDHLPGPVGARVRLNVSMAGEVGAIKGARFSPFVAEAEIVRVLEDKRGFSCRFKKISEDARKSIEAYIAQENS